MIVKLFYRIRIGQVARDSMRKLCRVGNIRQFENVYASSRYRIRKLRRQDRGGASVVTSACVVVNIAQTADEDDTHP